MAPRSRAKNHVRSTKTNILRGRSGVASWRRRLRKRCRTSRSERPPLQPAAARVECDLQRQFDRGFLCRSQDRDLACSHRLPSAFAALALLPELAFPQSQDVPPALAPQQGAILLGKYAAKGVQIYVAGAKGAASEWAFTAPVGNARRRGRQAVRQALCRSHVGSARRLQGGRQGFGEPARAEARRDSLAALVCGILRIGRTCRRSFCPAREHLRRWRAVRRVSKVGAEQRVDYMADYVFYK